MSGTVIRDPGDEAIEEYIKSLPYGVVIETDRERTLIAGNIRAFVQWLRDRHAHDHRTPPNESSPAVPLKVAPVTGGLTTDRSDPGLRKIRPDGMQEKYMVLSEEERAKGFIRPVRRSYIHLACGFPTKMGQALAETYARDNTYYSGTFCANCGKHFDLKNPDGTHNFEWVDDRQPVGS